MSDGIETFSATKNMARVIAGLNTPGPFYKTLLTPQPMSFVEGMPALTIAKLQGTPIKMSPIMDVWNARRANGSIK